MYWADVVDELKGYLAAKVSYSQIGKKFGVSKQAIAGAVRRHVYKIPDGRPTKGRHKRVRIGARRANVWTERDLTETWAERKARRAREDAHG